MVSLQAKSLESNIDTGKEQGGIELPSLLFRCLESYKIPSLDPLRRAPPTFVPPFDISETHDAGYECKTL
ncbi:hypothetical protein HLI_13500 [Halobacillus litoralis]|uniref:Uncharacterized protein n=1 Tax=Halobacillus litoralis TaxID=45668 RepID=A0A410MEK6_9BACI|nr:hypothetical protein HLI_13500 [Halobacillus litoralis]